MAVVISNGNAQNRGIKMQQNYASPKPRKLGAAKILYFILTCYSDKLNQHNKTARIRVNVTHKYNAPY